MNWNLKAELSSLPQGKYIIIDPCYVFGDSYFDPKFWDEFCAFSYPDGHKSRGPFAVEMDGKKWFTWSTAYGDGCYPVTQNAKLLGSAGVDAGCLAMIPLELLNGLEYDHELGVEVELHTNDSPDFDGNDGDMAIDDIFVCTCGCVDGEPEEE